MIPEEGILLLIDKPTDFTSHDVVNVIRKKFNTRRVGHGGTLDPFATGLLIVGVGRATKKLHDIVGLDKTYEATATLGATSDTYDLTGEILPAHIPDSQIPDSQQIEEVLKKYRGTIEQKAPAYSAKKVNGQKLYALAREGVDVEHLRPTKKVDITELVITNYNYPTLKFRVTCSSGTYIRSLAHDIGQKLGCGAYLSELKRTRIGSYELKDAKELNEL
ncbi:tRNA pseudouridine(55) synthase TruB [Candidatus Uhrbacteria bacterium]|nr:tRNA pseudouridine(55) synthase TruB [Candidatus Uhrbacteria bacterium]